MGAFLATFISNVAPLFSKLALHMPNLALTMRSIFWPPFLGQINSSSESVKFQIYLRVCNKIVKMIMIIVIIHFLSFAANISDLK